MSRKRRAAACGVEGPHSDACRQLGETHKCVIRMVYVHDRPRYGVVEQRALGWALAWSLARRCRRRERRHLHRQLLAAEVHTKGVRTLQAAI